MRNEVIAMLLLYHVHMKSKKAFLPIAHRKITSTGDSYGRLFYRKKCSAGYVSPRQDFYWTIPRTSWQMLRAHEDLCLPIFFHSHPYRSVVDHSVLSNHM